MTSAEAAAALTPVRERVLTMANPRLQADEILKAGALAGSGFERSQAGDGVQSARTSSTAWCECSWLDSPSSLRTRQRVGSC